jgi:predicted nucleotidyltransferase
METMTIDWVKEKNLLIFEAITGSKSYGLDTPTSDTDIRGVYVVPKAMYYSLEYPEQVSNETNDVVYYELRRFMELLFKNNPNIMEMLGVPEHCVLHISIQALRKNICQLCVYANQESLWPGKENCKPSGERAKISD